MSTHLSDLHTQCRDRVKALVTDDDLSGLGLSRAALSRLVCEIVERNAGSGRLDRIVACPLTARTRLAYIDRVIRVVRLEYNRVQPLAERHEPTWTGLFDRLTQRAGRILQRLNHTAPNMREALDFAQETCETIFREAFPYDVAFDAWATVILKNNILQHYQRSHDVLERAPEIQSIDRAPTTSADADSFALHELLADPTADPFAQAEVQDWLLAAIAQLPSEAQQRVIIEVYFYDRSEDEVARRLGKSPQAVYNLKHRALRRLKKVLDK
jgi:RNA polymerase sigma factor (sigma-70 family)